MKTLNPKRLGFAFGTTGVILYFGCILLMLIVGGEGMITFFNSLIHGVDVGKVVRIDIPWWETVLGIVETFVIGWLAGACVAVLYNLNLRKEE